LRPRRSVTATTTGTTEAPVWAVIEGAGGGTISDSGVYTAPSSAGVYHVTASFPSNSSVSATATVTVHPLPPNISVSINPSMASVQTGHQQQFTASVSGSNNQNVVWSITESTGGTITSGGLYTAPASAGIFHILAVAEIDSTKSATATVTVSTQPPPPPPPISISVSPSTASPSVNHACSCGEAADSWSQVYVLTIKS
jgi:hypothetical protein